MALITTKILLQNYELIRNQLGGIIGLELTEQSVLDNTFINPTIEIERVTDVNQTAVPLINICLYKCQYISNTPRLQHGIYTFYIDVYTDSASTPLDAGDKLAKVQMQNIMGKIRTILMNQAYLTLGFANPIPAGYAGIEGVSVTGFGIMSKAEAWDSLSSTVGRIVLTVKCAEGSPLGSGYLFEIGTSGITIGSGPNGYQVQINGLPYLIPESGGGYLLTEDGNNIISD